MSLTRIHELLARQLPDGGAHVAVRDYDGRDISYSALSDATDEIATDLAERGLKAGDRLVLVAENCAALIALVMAASRLGAIAVPLNARMSRPELARIVAHADPRMVVYLGMASAPAARSGEAEGAREITTRLGRMGISRTRPDPVPEPLNVTSDHPAVLLYTTGSTGNPKGVLLTHANLLYGGKCSAELRGLSRDDLILGLLPMAHVFGLTSVVLASIAVGACVWLYPRFSPKSVIEALSQGASVLPAVPQMHAKIIAEARSQGLTTLPECRLRYVSSGAAPLDPEWKRQAEIFYGIPLQNGYGLTETTAGMTLSRWTECGGGVHVGHALPEVEIRLRNVGPDGVGEIQTRGPHLMAGYFRNVAATRQAFDADGYFNTGDLGILDEAGHLQIKGRARDLIIRGGFNIYPPEIEAALTEHPDVVLAAVLGRSVRGCDEEVVAFCELSKKSTVGERDLTAYMADRVSAYKRPSRILLLDSLPCAPNGKILKHKLRAIYPEIFGAVQD